MGSTLCSIDIETSGLDSEVHEILEVGVILREEDGRETSHEFWLAATLDHADPKALEVNDYYARLDERRRAGLEFDSPEKVAEAIGALTYHAVWLGANPSFDLRFVQPLLRKYGVPSKWHYTPVDVKALMAGALGLQPPWTTDDLALRIGVDPADYKRHGALVDCRYVLDCYDAVFAIRPPIAIPVSTANATICGR